jgi:hypothetical protein
MTPILTNEQLHALRAANGAGPVPVVDPTTQTEYVLVRSDIFEQMQALVGEFDVRETYAAQASGAAKAGWDDPALDVYNEYDSHRAEK